MERKPRGGAEKFRLKELVNLQSIAKEPKKNIFIYI
jgi:hypothetical protein